MVLAIVNFVNFPPHFLEKAFSPILAPLRILGECSSVFFLVFHHFILNISSRWRLPHSPVEGWLWPQGEAGGCRRYGGLSCTGTGTALGSSAADPHHIDAEQNPSFHCDADPNPSFHFDSDPDPTFHFDVILLLIKMIRICDNALQ